MSRTITLRQVVRCIALLAALGGCNDTLTEANIPTTKSFVSASSSAQAVLTLSVASAFAPVPRRLLGNNVQWTDNADGLLVPGTTTVKNSTLNQIRRLGTTTLRYPGGAQADVYRWHNGIGLLAQRGLNEHFFTKASQRVAFGTAEFLELCQTLGAEPIITLNLVTATAQEAADWVTAVNITRMRSTNGEVLPKAMLWEVGNEPWHQSTDRPELNMTPEQYAQRANQWIRAIREADPSAKVSIALGSGSFAVRALPLITEHFDYASVHNAYYPNLAPGTPVAAAQNDNELFRALMGATNAVRHDLEFMQSQLRASTGRTVPMALTEYNSLFTLGGQRDDQVMSLAGGLYVADVLMFAATHPYIEMANFWSLVGNWNFGAFGFADDERPAAKVLMAMDQILRGNLVPAESSSPTFAHSATGMLAAASGISQLATLATREGNTLRVLLLNRDPVDSLDVTLAGLGTNKWLANVRTLTTAHVFDVTEGRDLQWSQPASQILIPSHPSITVPPHSLVWVEIDLNAPIATIPPTPPAPAPVPTPPIPTPPPANSSDGRRTLAYPAKAGTHASMSGFN